MTGTFTGYIATLGQLLLAGLAYTIRDWRWLQLAVSLPFFIFFLYSWWYAESARWLIMSGKSEQAVKELRKVARINGKSDECRNLNVDHFTRGVMFLHSNGGTVADYNNAKEPCYDPPLWLIQ